MAPSYLLVNLGRPVSALLGHHCSLSLLPKAVIRHVGREWLDNGKMPFPVIKRLGVPISKAAIRIRRRPAVR